MKRSKMISKIASVIINNNEPGSEFLREKALRVAEVILSFQEQLGMLPPTIKNPLLPNNMSRYHHATVIACVEAHGWQPKLPKDFEVNKWEEETDS